MSKKADVVELTALEAENLALDYKEMDIKDIMAWCQENNQVEWLKGIINTKVPYKVHPKKKVPKLDEHGNVMLTKSGKVKYTSVVDKNAEPTIKMQRPNFMHIKNEFVNTFMPELKPAKKEKEPNMYDLINSL